MTNLIAGLTQGKQQDNFLLVIDVTFREIDKTAIITQYGLISLFFSTLRPVVYVTLGCIQLQYYYGHNHYQPPDNL
jgi:hypothetical protein